jgi:AcrR family transcriptional regulator
MRKRAEDVDRTRLRIVEAAVELHRTVGPQASLSQIAERAGVTRATLYRHFPDLEALFGACSAHWLSQQDAPDPTRWVGRDAGARLRAALTDVYRFYAEADDMLTRVHRDIEILPAAQREGMAAERAERCEAVLGLLGPERRRRALVRRVVAHAVAFGTWRSLVVDEGVSPRAAVELYERQVESASEVRYRGMYA